jgi:hypothetical protein
LIADESAWKIRLTVAGFTFEKTGSFFLSRSIKPTGFIRVRFTAPRIQRSISIL